MRKLYGLVLATILCASSNFLFAQSSPITGKVLDVKDGSPMQGVTIKLKGGGATVTGPDGTFTLPASNGDVTVDVSAVGYLTRTMKITDRNGIVINLDVDQRALSEVVVVGYGTRSKRDVTSSIVKVTAKEFQNTPIPTFESALQGRASGVFINQGSGKLGQALNVRVRGISSISANQQPFVVVDGVPVVSRSLGSATEPDNPLATINPDDIESIEVLKDAASAAIYGSRASNGVILITTKSGKSGKTRVNFGYSKGYSKPTRIREYLNADQYRELFEAASTNEGYVAADEFQANTGTNDWNSTNNTDWNREAFQDGGITQYNLSISGGDARTKFLISGSWNDQEGIIVSNRLDRANGRVNLDHSLNSKVKVGMNLSMVKSRNYRIASDNAFTNPLQLNALPPIQPKYDSDGNLNSATLYYNNLIDVVASTNLSTTYRSISNIYGELYILPGLTFRSQLGVDWNNLQEEQYNGKETLDGAPTGLGYNNQVTSTVFTSTNTLNYHTKFGEKHDLDVLGGIEYQRGKTTGALTQGRGFPSNKFTKIASASIIEAGSSTETQFTFASYFAKANYKFNDKFLFGASVRVDGSSRFGSNNRYGVFPAASAGWIITEENFLKQSKAISFLKLRASYGKTGNAEIGNFSSLSLYSASAYADIAGLVASQIGIPDLSWERTDQFDVGLDFGFVNNRITGEIDFYTKDTKDLLLNVPVPAINGFTSVTRNIGSMKNQGFDFTLNGAILTGDFKWNASVNISAYKNEITKLVAPIPAGARTLGRLAVGQPYGQFFGREYAGVDPANGNALYYRADKTTTDSYSQAVDTVLGNPNPDFYGGFTNRFSFKGFDLDVLCQFVKGGDIYNIAGFFQSVNGDYFDNQSTDQMSYWKQPGDITNVPQPRLYAGNGAGKSSRWVQDGSYFRVKSVTLAYNIPRKILSKYKIENIRLYASANNLITITNYEGYDPEVNTTYVGNVNLGHDFYTPPQARTISFGINVGF